MRCRAVVSVLACAGLVLAGLVASAPPSQAVPPCGRTVVTHQRVIHAPVVHTPVVVEAVVAPVVTVPLIIPAAVFQYLPAVTAPSPVVGSPAYAPPAYPAGAYAPPAYPAGPGVSHAAAPCPVGADLDRLVAQRVEAALAARSGLVGRQAPLPMARAAAPALPADTAAPPVAAPTLEPPVAAPAPSAAPAPAASPPGVFPLAAVQAKCASCHTGASAKGGLAIFAAPGQLATLSRAQRAMIALQADQAHMPPAAGGNPQSPHALTDADTAALKRWAAAP